MVLVAEWPSFGKELLTRLTVFSRCGIFILILGFFNFGFDSNCTSLWQLFTFYFSKFHMPRKECD